MLFVSFRDFFERKKEVSRDINTKVFRDFTFNYLEVKHVYYHFLLRFEKD